MFIFTWHKTGVLCEEAEHNELINEVVSKCSAEKKKDTQKMNEFYF